MVLKTAKMDRNNPSVLQSGMAMRISLMISFFFHLVTIFVFPEIFSLPLAAEDLRTYRVDLIRPPVEEIGPEESTGVDMAPVAQEKRPALQHDQETISLDTKDKRYVSYAKLIKDKIRHHWKYPPEARQRLLEGKLMAIFSLGRDGNLTQIGVIQNSGHKILDSEAIRAIRAASPFPPFPEHISVGRLNVKATFDYRLTSRKRGDPT
jgi:TonB family protein